MLLRCHVTLTSRGGVSPDPPGQLSLTPLFSLVTSSSFASWTTKHNWPENSSALKKKIATGMPDDIALAGSGQAMYSQPTTQHWKIGRRDNLGFIDGITRKCGVTSVFGCLYRKPPSTFFIFIPLQARIIEDLARIFTPSKLRCHLLPFSRRK
jgi:hypothetical protein